MCRSTVQVETGTGPTAAQLLEVESFIQNYDLSELRGFVLRTIASIDAADRPAEMAAAIHCLTVLTTRDPQTRTFTVMTARGPYTVSAALSRAQARATAADGDGAADGVPPLALCETVLEFFEAASAPAENAHNHLEVKDGAARATELAKQGAFRALQAVLSVHATHSVVVRRSLLIMSSCVRIGMQAGNDVPLEAEEAFDRAGRLKVLMHK